MAPNRRTDHSVPRTATLLLFAGLVTSLTMIANAADPKPSAWTPELMMQVKRVGAVHVSPDGKQVAFTVREAVMEDDKSEYRTHIHLAGADGSDSVQLTQGEKSCDDPQWSP